MIKACLQDEIETDVNVICEFFHDEFDKDLLIVQLHTLGVLQHHFVHTNHVNVFNVKEYLCSLTPGFSALRRVKSYLRSNMTQECLNHLMLLRIYKEKVDSLNLKEVLNEFIRPPYWY